MNQKVMLINVEVVATSYIQKFKQFHLNIANEAYNIPDDFFESSISAAYDQKEKTNYRYPRFDLFNQDLKAIYDEINQEIHPNNKTLSYLVSLAQKYNYKVAFIFDQSKKQGHHLAEILTNWVSDCIVLFGDQSLLGKPEPNLYERAIKHFNASANHSIVIDSTRNGILAAFLANARSIYVDLGLGITERIFKYSTSQANDIYDIERLIQSIHNER
ncbi:MAG: HAD hydrolase-like protein [Erysipelothrix sp.]|nr:HAD hydrolase-like protein [Erysipelothrix sp.]